MCCSQIWAANAVSFHISGGIDNAAVKEKIERVVSELLTEANAAYEAGREMDYSKIGIPESAQSAISSLWNNSPFVCMDSDIVEHCIETGTGYQVRNIPLLLKPLKRSGNAEDEDYQEASVSFDKQGTLLSFYLSIGTTLYMNAIGDSRNIADRHHRQFILDYVEQLHTAYNQKNIKFFENLLGDDALVIIGCKTKETSTDSIPITYKKNANKEILSELRKAFKSNEPIRVTIDEIEVIRHIHNKDFYGVTLHQTYSSAGCQEGTYIFLLWDFRDEDHPRIQVCAWQPDSYNDGTGMKRIPKNEVFGLSDFDI